MLAIELKGCKHHRREDGKFIFLLCDPGWCVKRMPKVKTGALKYRKDKKKEKRITKGRDTARWQHQDLRPRSATMRRSQNLRAREV